MDKFDMENPTRSYQRLFDKMLVNGYGCPTSIQISPRVYHAIYNMRELDKRIIFTPDEHIYYTHGPYKIKLEMR